MKTDTNHITKWFLPRPIKKQVINDCSLNYILQKVLRRRGIDIDNNLDEFIEPKELPNPEEHFTDLNKASKRIIQACEDAEKIAEACGMMAGKPMDGLEIDSLDVRMDQRGW